MMTSWLFILNSTIKQHRTKMFFGKQCSNTVPVFIFKNLEKYYKIITFNCVETFSVSWNCFRLYAYRFTKTGEDSDVLIEALVRYKSLTFPDGDKSVDGKVEAITSLNVHVEQPYKPMTLDMDEGCKCESACCFRLESMAAANERQSVTIKQQVIGWDIDVEGNTNSYSVHAVCTLSVISNR